MGCPSACLQISEQPCAAFGQDLAEGPITLWVDAICINQDDSDEKSAQVAIMSVIYRMAEDVLIFLGEAADGSDQIMEYLLLDEVDNTHSSETLAGRLKVTLLMGLQERRVLWKSE